FAERCVLGIEADAERCRELVERSAALATALTPYIGYETAAAIAKESLRTGRSIRQIVEERGLLKGDDLQAILSPKAMTEPGIGGKQ
ncbi:MAG: aspartate ammonia-lyase, partial [Chloroflexi bacterium]|nr:aspartate ammonia-lyase [Chloroflexota bacterium]